MRMDVQECRAPDTGVSCEWIDQCSPCPGLDRASDPSLAFGARVDGRYRLLRHIGSGGMGDVYEAEDRFLGRRVAMKVLRERAPGREPGRQQLAREARLAARVQHPNIVRVYELGSIAGVDYVVMELLEGEDLQARIRRCGALPVDVVERLGRGLTSAMIAMHDAAIVHRDLKPGNLFLAREGGEPDLLKVLDFGVAKGGLDTSARCTESGRVFGTLAYMAPEQLRGARHAGPQGDIWSAGAVLYEAITGRLPFEADSIADLVSRIASVPPVPVERLRSEVPAHLAAAVRRALSRDPATRFSSARDFHAALTGQCEQSACALTQPWPVESLCATPTHGAGRDRSPTAAALRRAFPVLAIFAVLLLVTGGLRWLVSAPTSRPASGAASAAVPPRRGVADRALSARESAEESRPTALAR